MSFPPQAPAGRSRPVPQPKVTRAREFFFALAVAMLFAGWGPAPTFSRAPAPERAAPGTGVQPVATTPAAAAGPDAGAEASSRAPAPPASRDVTGIDCAVPAAVSTDADVEIACVVPASPQLAKLVLRFRPASRSSYFARVMTASADHTWRGTIPSHLLTGSALHVFVEIADRSRQPLATWNSKDSPFVMMLRGSGSSGGNGSDTANLVFAEENPLDQLEREPPPFRRRRWWFGLAAGDGLGWSLEAGPDATRAMPARTADLHIAPEVGYYLSPRIGVAVAGRHQWLQQPARGGVQPSGAHLGLLRLLAFSGTGRHRLYAAGVLGAGTGFRLVPSQASDAFAQGRGSVRGGPFVSGVAVGYSGDLERSRLAFTAELGGLVGFPDAALLLDLRIGMAAYF